MEANPLLNQFIDCLQKAEETRDPRDLVGLFSDKARLQNLTRHTGHHPDHTPSPREFWSQYLYAFDHVRSHFTDVFTDGDTAVLEWTSEGALPTGLPIRYAGVSILKFKDNAIEEFRTYYDSAAFLPHAHGGKPYSETVGRSSPNEHQISG